jgi:SAM-dependent methyltransferase
LPRLALYQFAGVRPTDHVLDIGTGAGFAALHWSRIARSVLGADISQPAITLAHNLVPPTSAGRIHYECADVTDPAFAARHAGQFHLVTSSDVMEHVQDPDALVRCIRATLRSGGRAIVTFPNERDGHGVTSFPSSTALIDLFVRHGLRAEVRVLSVTGWADAVHQLLWRRPLLIYRRRRRTHEGQTEQPQVLHETWYCHVAQRSHPAYLVINGYARLVEALMTLCGPSFRAYIVRPDGEIADRRVLVRAWLPS